MAFPQIADTTDDEEGSTAASTHTISFPATVDAEDLLVAVAGFGVGSQITTWPSPWTKIGDYEMAGNESTMSVAYMEAVGDEDATTFELSFDGGASRRALVLYRITGWESSLPPEVSTIATGTSTAPDPASLTASWGSADNLWIEFMCGESGGTNMTTQSTGFSTPDNSAEDGTGTGGAAVCWASDENATATLDADAMVSSASEPWMAGMIVIAPTGAAAAAAGGQLVMGRRLVG
jgi:hypothetical protein